MTLSRKIAPEFGHITAFSFLPVVTSKTDGGVPCYFINGGSEDVVKIDFIFDAGSKRQHKTCLAAATNNLLMEGTRKNGSLEIADKLDSLGAFIQNSCSADDATISVYSLNKNIGQCLEIINEIFNEASFPEKELHTYANTQAGRLRISQKKTDYRCRRAFNAALFGAEHPYGRSANPEDFLSLQREELASFFSENYTTGGLKIICSGKITEDIRLRIHQLGFKNNKPQTKLPDFSLKPDSNRKQFISHSDSVQSSIRIGKRMFDRTHEDYRPMQLLNLILGGYFGSRLMKNIREEKGLTYGIYSSLESFRGDGVFYISTDVNNDSRSSAVTEIYNEIERLKNEPIPPKELEIAKNYFLGAFLRGLDGAFLQSEKTKTLIDYNLKKEYYTELFNIIKETNSEKLIYLANKHLRANDFYEIICGL
ncbi:MAG: insulinase family protein [Bacteroidia bacterium]|nr:insulinase family protein [Bacteroidia bacterium]